tara:strand:+ start:181 stop:489 length:309 start_codon:yes stop_codon:yes gene_type:complete
LKPLGNERRNSLSRKDEKRQRKSVKAKGRQSAKRELRDFRTPLRSYWLSKKEKLAIFARNGTTVSGDEMYTEEEWSRIMWATHSEIKTVLREIMENKQNERG